MYASLTPLTLDTLRLSAGSAETPKRCGPGSRSRIENAHSEKGTYYNGDMETDVRERGERSSLVSVMCVYYIITVCVVYVRNRER